MRTLDTLATTRFERRQDQTVESTLLPSLASIPGSNIIQFAALAQSERKRNGWYESTTQEIGETIPYRHNCRRRGGPAKSAIRSVLQVQE